MFQSVGAFWRYRDFYHLSYQQTKWHNGISIQTKIYVIIVVIIIFYTLGRYIPEGFEKKK